MYYKIIADGQVWYSKEIIKAHQHCGDDAIQRKLLDGSLSACAIFDRIVYSADKSEQKKIDAAFSPVVQDLDSAIKTLKKPETTNGLERVGYDPSEPVYEYKGLKFVKFNAVRCRSKYHMQFRLPVVEVCGFKFVALECVKAGEGYIIY